MASDIQKVINLNLLTYTGYGLERSERIYSTKVLTQSWNILNEWNKFNSFFSCVEIMMKQSLIGQSFLVVIS